MSLEFNLNYIKTEEIIPLYNDKGRRVAFVTAYDKERDIGVITVVDTQFEAEIKNELLG